MDRKTLRRLRKRRTRVLLLSGAASIALMAVGVTSAMSAFSASVTNNSNRVATGTLLLEEDGPDGSGSASSCLSTSGTGSVIDSANANAACGINLFGANGVNQILGKPGSVYTTSITIKNNGNLDSTSFTLTPGGCSQTNATAIYGTSTDFCAKVKLKVHDDTSDECVTDALTSGACATNPTLTALGTTALTVTNIAAGASATFTFTVTIDNTIDNSYQGLQASDSFTWAFA